MLVASKLLTTTEKENLIKEKFKTMQTIGQIIKQYGNTKTGTVISATKCSSPMRGKRKM